MKHIKGFQLNEAKKDGGIKDGQKGFSPKKQRIISRATIFGDMVEVLRSIAPSADVVKDRSEILKAVLAEDVVCQKYTDEYFAMIDNLAGESEDEQVEAQENFPKEFMERNRKFNKVLKSN